jgi:hypothetical protein
MMGDLVIEVYGTLIFMAALAVSSCMVVWFALRTLFGWIERKWIVNDRGYDRRNLPLGYSRGTGRLYTNPADEPADDR